MPDDSARIAEAVNALRGAYDYLFTTGGIGPTHDDITVDAIAAALGVPVVVHPKARAALEAYYAGRGGVTEARLRMARVPEGAELIENRMSGAPGIRLGNIFILAGVPHIAGLMLEALAGPARGRQAARFRRRSAAGRRKARSPTCSARPSAPIPAARSAPIPSSGRAGSAPISSSAAPRRRRSRPAAPISPRGSRRPGGRSSPRSFSGWNKGAGRSLNPDH